MWRVSCALLGALLVCGVAVWWSRAAESANPRRAAIAEEVRAPLEPRFSSRVEKSQDQAGRSTVPFHDPIVLSPCTLVPLREQDVSSQVDGVFQQVLVDLGDRVTAGQLLGRLDDGPLRPQVELLELKAKSRSAELIAQAQYDEASARMEFAHKARQAGSGVISELEYQTLRHQRERFAREVEKAREERLMASKELDRARQLLQQHEVRSVLPGEVVKVYKRNGESVKQGEALFRVANFHRLRVEGFCKAQQADLVRLGMRAIVEPELSSGQLGELRGHVATVTGLAVSPGGRWVASASEDRSVILWAWPSRARRAVLPHPAEVHAVAFAPWSGKKGPCRLLTGCADGRVRAWSVSDQGAVEELNAWSDRHEGAIRALAVSGDGLLCASGGEDRRIAVWDAERGARLHWLRADRDERGTAHHGAVTSLQFTADGCLVSAGRDNALNVWKLGKEPSLTSSASGRTGEVARLGVSPDGKHLLFDQGEELRLLDREGACVGSLACRGQGRFQGLALFSPTGRLVLAAGTNGRLQLLRAPADPRAVAFFRAGYSHGFHRDSLLALGGPSIDPLAAPLSSVLRAGLGGGPILWGLHGYEVRHFLAPSTAVVHCAAFAPDESVVFTGGSDQTVRIWPVPAARAWAQPREATITFVGSQVERGTDRVRVRAEMDNPEDEFLRLRPGTNVDLRLYPETRRTKDD